MAGGENGSESYGMYSCWQLLFFQVLYWWRRLPREPSPNRAGRERNQMSLVLAKPRAGVSTPITS